MCKSRTGKYGIFMEYMQVVIDAQYLTDYKMKLTFDNGGKVRIAEWTITFCALCVFAVNDTLKIRSLV